MVRTEDDMPVALEWHQILAWFLTAFAAGLGWYLAAKLAAKL